jgi:hypothetical protein
MKKYNFYLDMFHYFLLTLVLFLAFFSLNKFGFVNMSSSLTPFKWVGLFVWYFIFIVLGDKLIHYLLKI